MLNAPARMGFPEEGDLIPRKYQNGKLELRRDVKRPYYFVRATLRGRRAPHMLGFRDEMTHKQAMAARAAFLEQVNQGRMVSQSRLLFRDLARRYMDTRLGQLAVPTQDQYRCQITNHLVPGLGALKLADIDRPAIEQFIAEKGATLGWWARNNLRGILSGIFAAAIDWKLWQGENPAKGVRIGKKTVEREKRLLTGEQMRTLLAALPDRLRFLVLIQFGLGLRISEALGLKWSDVDFERASIKIQRRWYRGDLSEETKTEGSTAELLLSESLLAEFRQRRKLAGFIFLGDDGRNPPDDRDLLRFEFRPILVNLGLYYPGFGWHAFRRQSITWRQTVGGATPLEAQKAARHASLDMTMLYTLSDRERETAQQQRMMDELIGRAEGPTQ